MQADINKEQGCTTCPCSFLFGKRIYIIGSMTQADYIQSFASYLSFPNVSVDYVHPEPYMPFSQCIEQCYALIDKADVLIAISKPDGSFGDGVMYELAYASHTNPRKLRITVDVRNSTARDAAILAFEYLQRCFECGGDTP